LLSKKWVGELLVEEVVKIESKPDAGLVCLAMLARLHGRAADPDQLKHRLAIVGDAKLDDLLQACKELDLRGKAASIDMSRVIEAKLPLPCIIETRAGIKILAGVNPLGAPQVLIHDPVEGRPVGQTLEEFRASLDPSNQALFVTSRASLAAQLVHFDFTWFIPAVVKYRRLLVEALTASLFLQIFALLTPLFFQVVMDKVLVHKGLSTLNVISIGLLGVVIFESLLSALRNYVFAHTTSRMDVELGAQLFRHLMALPLAYFEARRVGDSVARVRELENIRQFLTGQALTSIIDLLFTVVFLAVMWYYSATLTLVVLASLPVYVLLMVSVMPTFRKRLGEKFARGAENQSFLVESVTNIQTLKAGAVEPQTIRRWDEQLAAYVASSFRVARVGLVASEAIQLTQKLVTVALMFLGAKEVMDGNLTVGGLVAFNMLAGRVSQPVIRLAQMWQELQQVGISVARLGDILNTRTENGGGAASESTPGAARTAMVSRTQLPAIKGDIQFDQVRFRYRPEGSEVLRGVSFSLRAGEVLGIVGRSGSGKSTIAKLIQRLYVPERGRVLVDGADLAMADPSWLRRQIGVVLQENRLFARSVRENIALADPGVPMEVIVAVAKMAGAHDFILELPEAYDTIVGEQGATLSGGQRQRIAIARALLTNPRILILDEATSALDYESERIIQDNMRFIAKGRSVVIIAHRLSAVRDASRIIVMEQGEIAEIGTHTELLKQPESRYSRLHSMQAG
jgi:ATP-binding cassette, subfamily B, bacterial HlyB/CyaB